MEGGGSSDARLGVTAALLSVFLSPCPLLPACPPRGGGGARRCSLVMSCNTWLVFFSFLQNVACFWVSPRSHSKWSTPLMLALWRVRWGREGGSGDVPTRIFPLSALHFLHLLFLVLLGFRKPHTFCQWPILSPDSQHVAPGSHQTSDLETESPKNECSGPFLPAVEATGSPFHHLRQVRAVTTAPESREKGLPAGGMNVTAFGATL